VDVGEPQSAKIVVIPQKGAKVGVSTISRGNLTEVFERETSADRATLTWQTPDTGNETEIFIRANYRYYNVLGYRKRLSGVISEIKKRV
jgi:hypothetical protein